MKIRYGSRRQDLDSYCREKVQGLWKAYQYLCGNKPKALNTAMWSRHSCYANLERPTKWLSLHDPVIYPVPRKTVKQSLSVVLHFNFFWKPTLWQSPKTVKETAKVKALILSWLEVSSNKSADLSVPLKSRLQQQTQICCQLKNLTTGQSVR